MFSNYISWLQNLNLLRKIKEQAYGFCFFSTFPSHYHSSAIGSKTPQKITGKNRSNRQKKMVTFSMEYRAKIACSRTQTSQVSTKIKNYLKKRKHLPKNYLNYVRDTRQNYLKDQHLSYYLHYVWDTCQRMELYHGKACFE